jgi:hypothetical protein
MSIHIAEEFMSVEIDGRVVATARFSRHAAADGRGAWIVSSEPGRRLFSRNQAITALTVAELLSAGSAEGDPLVTALRGELR